MSNYVIATNAPKEYDYEHTTEIGGMGCAHIFDTDVRVVVVELDDRGTYLGEYQRDRYLSGTYISLGQEVPFRSHGQEVSDIELANILVDISTGQ